MKHLTTLGALAVVGAAGAALAGSANAHTVAVACEGNRIVARGDLFPASPLVTEARLTVDGVARPPQIVDPGIPGPRPVYTFPELLYGEHVVVVTLRNGGDWTSPATRVVCGPPPVTPQPPAETPTGGGGTTPPADCAANLARFPGAGPEWRDRWGCPASRTKVKPPPRPPRTGTIAPPCRTFGTSRPARGVAEHVRPTLGKTFRVARGVDGRWRGFRDRFRVTRYADGDVVVQVQLGAFCGPTRYVAGNG